MRKPGPRPGRGHIFAKQVLRAAWNVANNRRIDVAISELGAYHLVRLALLDVGDLRQAVPYVLALHRVVANACLPHGAPFSPADRRVARGAHIALSHLPALDLVRGEKARAAPTLQGS